VNKNDMHDKIMYAAQEKRILISLSQSVVEVIVFSAQHYFSAYAIENMQILRFFIIIAISLICKQILLSGKWHCKNSLLGLWKAAAGVQSEIEAAINLTSSFKLHLY
jgi:hypothetical protein